MTVALEVVATALPVLAVTPGEPRTWERRLAWTAGAILTGHGTVFTVAGLLVLGGVIPMSADADLRATRGMHSCGTRGSWCGGCWWSRRCDGADPGSAVVGWSDVP